MGTGDGTEDDRVDDTVTRRRLRISTRSGRIEVVAEDRPDVMVEKGGRGVEPEVDGSGGLTITGRSSSIVARVPIGTDVVVGSVSGRVSLTGVLGRCGITTMSGRVEVDTVESLDVRSVSGRLKVGHASSRLRMDTASGRVNVGSCGDLRVGAVSARVEVDEARGLVEVRTVSGRVSVNMSSEAPRVRAETISGRVTIYVPDSASPLQRYASKSGSIRSAVPDGGDPEHGSVEARTISGSIRVRVRED